MPTTLAELNPIAPAASNGKKLYISGPNIGTRAPAAIGINAVLYAKAQKRFCFIDVLCARFAGVGWLGFALRRFCVTTGLTKVLG